MAKKANKVAIKETKGKKDKLSTKHSHTHPISKY